MGSGHSVVYDDDDDDDDQRFAQQVLENVNCSDSRGETPLHIVASLGKADFVEALINHGASINAVDNEGRTPLIAALQSENPDPDVIKTLIARAKESSISDDLMEEYYDARSDISDSDGLQLSQLSLVQSQEIQNNLDPAKDPRYIDNTQRIYADGVEAVEGSDDDYDEATIRPDEEIIDVDDDTISDTLSVISEAPVDKAVSENFLTTPRQSPLNDTSETSETNSTLTPVAPLIMETPPHIEPQSNSLYPKLDEAPSAGLQASQVSTDTQALPGTQSSHPQPSSDAQLSSDTQPLPDTQPSTDSHSLNLPTQPVSQASPQTPSSPKKGFLASLWTSIGRLMWRQTSEDQIKIDRMLSNLETFITTQQSQQQTKELEDVAKVALELKREITMLRQEVTALKESRNCIGYNPPDAPIISVPPPPPPPPGFGSSDLQGSPPPPPPGGMVPSNLAPPPPGPSKGWRRVNLDEVKDKFISKVSHTLGGGPAVTIYSKYLTYFQSIQKLEEFKLFAEHYAFIVDNYQDDPTGAHAIMTAWETRFFSKLKSNKELLEHFRRNPNIQRKIRTTLLSQVDSAIDEATQMADDERKKREQGAKKNDMLAELRARLEKRNNEHS